MQGTCVVSIIYTADVISIVFATVRHHPLHGNRWKNRLAVLISFEMVRGSNVSPEDSL